MKNYILSLILISSVTILFTSCKKEKNKPDPNFFISFKMDGVQKIFKSKTQAAKVSSSQDDFNSILFSAYEDSASPEFIYFQIGQKSKQISTGTYVDPGPDSENLIVVAGYTPPNQEPEKEYSTGMQDDNNPRLEVTINTIADAKVSGTFSGTFYHNDGDDGASAVTEGKFNLPLH